MKTCFYLPAKLLFLLLTLSCGAFTAFAQQVAYSSNAPQHIPAAYAEPMEGDKYKLHFTFDYRLTNSSCTSITREVNFDQEEKIFNGPFIDKRADGTVIAAGFYKDGYLDSTLVIRYLNGNVWQKGSYKNNEMLGTWEYFFPDGKPMYTLEIEKGRVYVNTVWDKDGSLLVENGNGRGIIHHYEINSYTNELTYSWRGKIKNGLLQGMWKFFKYSEPMGLKQVYNKGQFIKGYDQGQQYNTVNLLSLNQPLRIIDAEMLEVAECDANPTNDLPPFYPLGEVQLRSEIYKELDKIRRNLSDHGLIKISFHVDAAGRLSDFKEESDIGVEKILIEVLGKLGPWVPATQLYKPVKQRTTYSMYYVNKKLREWENRPNKAYEGWHDLSDALRLEKMQEPKVESFQWKKIQ
ncbi:hypothetical protein [uncultured Pontibacter sp.]|uniref:toxin-antitoxin system YwqK family antitoxin n=1 Tax=uncultured Pontibacter sp. TaxID=453356 RepID=UPI0026163571|nr:hypothetical protein [uncultured Pontibacter sp.]